MRENRGSPLDESHSRAFCIGNGSTSWQKKPILERVEKMIKKKVNKSGAGEPLKLMGPKVAIPKY